MPSPIYETALDKMNERAVANYLRGAPYWLHLEEMRRFNEYDHINTGMAENCRVSTGLTNGGHFKAVNLFEIKCRKNYSTDYPTYLISKRKMDFCIQAARELESCGVVLVVRFLDKIMAYKHNFRPIPNAWLGTAPHKSGGFEAAYYIPLELFETV